MGRWEQVVHSVGALCVPMGLGVGIGGGALARRQGECEREFERGPAELARLGGQHAAAFSPAESACPSRSSLSCMKEQWLTKPRASRATAAGTSARKSRKSAAPSGGNRPEKKQAKRGPAGRGQVGMECPSWG